MLHLSPFRRTSSLGDYLSARGGLSCAWVLSISAVLGKGIFLACLSAM